MNKFTVTPPTHTHQAQTTKPSCSGFAQSNSEHLWSLNLILCPVFNHLHGNKQTNEKPFSSQEIRISRAAAVLSLCASRRKPSVFSICSPQVLERAGGFPPHLSLHEAEQPACLNISYATCSYPRVALVATSLCVALGSLNPGPALQMRSHLLVPWLHFCQHSRGYLSLPHGHAAVQGAAHQPLFSSRHLKV